MVVTPWGDSDSLRGRQLQPVRGAPASEVEQNQRERLFAALVACLDARGYAATTVADLSEVSGVSSRSFYDLFGEKSRCLREMIEAILEKAGPLEGDRGAGLEDWLAERYRAFATAIEAQPAAAKACLSEALVAGEVALAPLEAAISGFERELARRFASDPEREGMPAQLIAARVGGVLEVARERLRLGRESELEGMGEDLVRLILADRPPPEPLRLGVRPGKAEAESLAAPGHAERAIRAFAVLVAERGYAATTVDEVVKRASMSARTFYANFSGKEDLMAAAIEGACAQAVAAVMPAFSRHSQWPQAIRAGYGALLDFLASRPALGRLLTVDVYAAGEAAVELRRKGLEPLVALLEANTSEWELMPPVIYDAIVGGVQHLRFEAVRRSGADALPALAPISTFLTLAPFIGAEAACEVANGSGARGETTGLWSLAERPGAIPLRAPLRTTVIKALTMLDEGPATPREVAAKVGEEPAIVAEYLLELAAIGAIASDTGKEGEPVYSSASGIHKLKAISAQQLAAMEPEEHDELSRYTWRVIARDVERGLEGGSFRTRLDNYLTRTPMLLDETGWRELTDLHSRALHEGFEIQARSRQRLEESGAPAIEARSMQIAFEMPAGEAHADAPPDEGDGERGESGEEERNRADEESG